MMLGVLSFSGTAPTYACKSPEWRKQCEFTDVHSDLRPSG